MSIDTHAHHDAHADGGHHEPPEVVDGRQRMSIWLFIGGDALTLAALVFTYLYLRGVNTSGHWMSMLGYPGPQLPGGHSWSYYDANVFNGSNPASPTNVVVGPLSAGLNWLGTAVTAASAGLIWLAERALRVAKNKKAFTTLAALGTIVAFVAILISFHQLSLIPQIYSIHNDSAVMAFTAYGSSMMIIIGSGIVHLILLVFLGIGLTLRSARGAINLENWYQSRLVRMFWVLVAISAVAISALTTTINTIH